MYETVAPPKKKKTTAKLSFNRKPETITYEINKPGAETKSLTKKVRKPGGVARIGQPKKTVVMPTREMMTIKTLVPMDAEISSEIPNPPSPPQKPIPENPQLRIDQKKVRRLITARDGMGYHAMVGQSLPNKVQRIKDKIRRLISPTMGGADYYLVQGGKSKRINKEAYKKMKKSGVRTYM